MYTYVLKVFAVYSYLNLRMILDSLSVLRSEGDLETYFKTDTQRRINREQKT